MSEDMDQKAANVDLLTDRLADLAPKNPPPEYLLAFRDLRKAQQEMEEFCRQLIQELRKH